MTFKVAMPDYPELFVLRHGQTEWNSIGRFQGRMDSPLTRQGREQARCQSRILAGLLQMRGDVALFSSPQGRAAETAKLALAPLGRAVISDDRLCEISFGSWEGLTFDQIAAGWPRICEDYDQPMFDWNFQSPDGENFDAVCARAQDFLDAMDGPAAIVSHGILSRVLRGLWLGVGCQDMAAMPGGQGCVHHLKSGRQRCHRGP